MLFDYLSWELRLNKSRGEKKRPQMVANNYLEEHTNKLFLECFLLHSTLWFVDS